MGAQCRICLLSRYTYIKPDRHDDIAVKVDGYPANPHLGTWRTSGSTSILETIPV